VGDPICVRTSDGLQLAARASGPHDKPVIVLIHGYPDHSAVWDGVVRVLSADYRVVTYDVRGAGASSKPSSYTAYRLRQLLSDLGRVIDAFSPTRTVHLVGHDWGSIQGWHAVTSAGLCDRIASYTSISAPNIDHASLWVWRRIFRSFRDWLNVVIQLLSSAYIAVFVLPGIAELLWVTGVFGAILRWLEGESAGRLSEQLHGLKLYRANFFQKLLWPHPERTHVPVQVLAPERDVYVRVPSQVQAPVPWTTQLTLRVIPGRHWVMRQHPELVARRVRDFVEQIESVRGRDRSAASAARS